ncbi:MAG: SDR family NAD(P)-dependent oxidoreductase [Candidatus Zixiibacteriota bacterium]
MNSRPKQPSSSSHGSLGGKRALVTGAGGFIGSHLVEYLLSHGAKVTAFFRYTSEASTGNLSASAALKSVRPVFGDIRDPESCERAVKGQDYIFHLAAQIAIPYSYLSPRDFVEVNVNGTTNLLQAALGTGSLKRFVAVSSSEVYGSAQYTPIDEAHPLAPQSPYAASKVASDKMVEAYGKSFGLPTTVVRPFNTYGPRQSARAIMPTVILQGLRSSRIKLGTTAAKRDFLHVQDTVRGLAKAATGARTIGVTVNLCSGNEISIRELVKITGEIIGKKLTVTCDARRLRPKDSEVMRLLGDGTKARKLCGFSPSVTLEAGLKETIEHYQQIGATLSGNEYRI